MSMRVIAGDCTVRSGGRRETTRRGRVVVKPDDTVLVHDADGYQPVAWLTRPAELTLTTDPLWLVAVTCSDSSPSTATSHSGSVVSVSSAGRVSHATGW